MTSFGDVFCYLSLYSDLWDGVIHGLISALLAGEESLGVFRGDEEGGGCDSQCDNVLESDCCQF